jgi:hypothetical protein
VPGVIAGSPCFRVTEIRSPGPPGWGWSWSKQPHPQKSCFQEMQERLWPIKSCHAKDDDYDDGTYTYHWGLEGYVTKS